MCGVSVLSILFICVGERKYLISDCLLRLDNELLQRINSGHILWERQEVHKDQLRLGFVDTNKQPSMMRQIICAFGLLLGGGRWRKGKKKRSCFIKPGEERNEGWDSLLALASLIIQRRKCRGGVTRGVGGGGVHNR